MVYAPVTQIFKDMQLVMPMQKPRGRGGYVRTPPSQKMASVWIFGKKHGTHDTTEVLSKHHCRFDARGDIALTQRDHSPQHNR